jgi:hypothetical protein
MNKYLRRAAVSAGALGLVAAGMAVVAPAISAPPEPTGSLVYAAALGDGEFSMQLHTLDLSNGADVALPGTRTMSTSGSTTVSPDGAEVAVISENPMDFGDSLDVYDLASHSWTGLAHATDAGIGGPAWLPDSAHLVAQLPDGPDYATSALWIYALDGSRTLIPGTRLPNLTGITSFAVAPSGLQIAFSKRVSGVDKVFMMNIDGSSVTALGSTGRVRGWLHDGSRLLLSDSLAGTDGRPAGSVLSTVTPRGGSPTPLPLSYTATSSLGASLSPDDAWLAIESETVQDTYASTVQVVPLAGGAAPRSVLSSTTTVFGPSYLGPWTADDAAAPTMTPVSAALGATSTVLSWPSVAAPDAVGVQVALSPGTTPPATYAAGAKRTTVLGATRTAAFTGLAAGATYSWSAWALDGAGNASTPVTGHLRLIPEATLTVPALASATSSSGLAVTYQGHGGGTAGVRIAYYVWQTTGTGLAKGVGTKVVPGTAGTYVFPADGTGILGGSRVGLRAGAVDAYGNVRWSTTTAISTVPLDDRDALLRYSGTWTRPTTTGAWLGTTSVTGSGGSASVTIVRATRSAAPRRFSVVATVSPTSGRAKVYVDGRYVTTVSTRSTTTGLRRTVWTSGLLSSATHRLQVVQVPGSGWLRLDAIGVLLTA